MNISEKLKQELKKADRFNNGGNDNSFTSRKNELVRINSKNSFFGRIIPLGEEEWFATEYSSVFIQFLKSDGTKASVVAELDVNNPNDELYSLTAEAISWNKNNPNNKIKFDMNPNNKYDLSINNRVEVVGIPVTKNPNGGFMMELSKTIKGCPQLNNYDMSKAAYYSVLGLLDEGYTVGGNPFATELQFITLDKTFPLSIKLGSDGKHYDVQARADIVLPEVPKAVLLKDDSGEFKYIDDPNKYHEPLITKSPDFYETIVKVVKDKIAKVKGSSTISLSNDSIESEDNEPADFGNKPNDFEKPKDNSDFDTDTNKKDPFEENLNEDNNNTQDPDNDFGDFDAFGDSDDDFDGNQSFEDFLNNN